MRPINDAEYKRMQLQAESKIVGAAEIGFVCKYVDATATPAIDVTTWLETGYMADFRPSGFGHIDASGTTPQAYSYAQNATCKFPMRYYTDPKTFVSRQAPIAAAMGKEFKLNILRSGSPFLDNGVISCYAIRLLSHNNIEPQYFNTMEWTLIAEPQIRPDGVELLLAGSETLRIYNWMRADYIPIGRVGYLIGGEVFYQYGDAGYKYGSRGSAALRGKR